MAERRLEYPWLNKNETMYFNDIQYRVEVQCNPGCYHFYIIPEHDTRPITRELVDEYIKVLGIVVNEIPETPEPHQHDSHCIEIDNARIDMDVISVSRELAEPLAVIADEPPRSTGICNFSTSLSKWSMLFSCKATPFADRYEYANVAGYDKIVIVNDIVAVYVGEEYEFIRIPETIENRKLIMSDELIEAVRRHELMVSSR